ncbi:MAG TPA: N(4)-(beta-N-acetylglucosaminyl)-L-asparaginase [Thermoprotei archaeon]|nr:N(4)-(beta-N-acetylglucosaminyl)-L-asparaginase [Thermoprotei archaeon]
MVLAASYHDFGLKAVEMARKILEKGGSALDAVEYGIRVIEEDPSVDSVGLNGRPNIEGIVELDAGIMDGSSLRGCGVGGVRNVVHPITLARKCLENTSHALIVGEGALEMAKIFHLELSSPPKRVLDEYNRAMIDFREKVKRGEISPKYRNILKWFGKIKEDTIGVIAIDLNKNIASATSTSGLAYKVPGRVGDSAIIGAGFYAENRVGAAILTGLGEVAIRINAAKMAVDLLRKGYDVKEAAVMVIEKAMEIAEADGEKYNLGIVVVDSDENVGACALNWDFKYVYWRDGMDKPVLAKSSKIVL